MKRILVLGSTGMLGNAILNHFASLPQYEVIATYRTDDAKPELDRSIKDVIYFDAANPSLDELPVKIDYMINCIGVIKPFMAADPIAAISLNSLLPWRLADWCHQHGSRLLHITTDCVYSGAKGKYLENDLHDAFDDYGKSKSLGECTSRAMVLRTSIIGEEIHKFASLISWAKNQKGKTIGGFSTHLWNGVTTNQYAKICDRIISEDWYETGLFHIHAKDDVSKLDMMNYFNETFDLNLTIEEKMPVSVDRTLRSEKSLCAKLEIPTVREMIAELGAR
ncbi:sugar nucleotide-binding protein [Paenibacillus glycinis]|uniref:Sugar nucleotide-binding protein n=1 Tax=Paenibacillus glycinis TaxID=2697035 RepID=A0ABW9XWQ6_9BACL|nr:sugar nucleotide-binding protein [Paenibacillus glycinis]NBD26696.1 sugar nucleotide-binding protein [Paenibacillus glycinis]